VICDESTVQWAEVPPRHRRSVMDPGPPLVAFLRCLVAGATAVGIFRHVHTPLPAGSAPPAAPMPYFDSRPVMACDARGIASFLTNLGRRHVESARAAHVTKQKMRTARQATSIPRQSSQKSLPI